MSPPLATSAARARRLLLALCLAACGAEGDGSGQADDDAAWRALRTRALALDEQRAPHSQRLDAWREARELRPRAPFVLRRLGAALLDASLQGEAVEVLAEAVERQPGDAETRRELARVLLELGRDDAARAQLLEARRLGQDAPELLVLLATVEDRAGRRDAARALLDEVVRRWPDDAGAAHALRGRFHLAAGELDAARADFAAAVALRPEDTTALKGLADVARRAGEHALADRWDEVLRLLVELSDNVVLRDDASFRKPRLRRLAELHPAWIAGWHELATRLVAAGRSDEACALVQEQFARLPALSDELRAELRARFCEGR